MQKIRRKALWDRYADRHSKQNCVFTGAAAENKHYILKEDEVPGAKLLKEPEKCVVEELKRRLVCHGLKKSGKKVELINRVKDGLQLNLSTQQLMVGSDTI